MGCLIIGRLLAIFAIVLAFFPRILAPLMSLGDSRLHPLPALCHTGVKRSTDTRDQSGVAIGRLAPSVTKVCV
jgi:hypothetical protein